MSGTPLVLYAVTSAVTAEAFLSGQLGRVAKDFRVGLVVGDEIPQALIEDEGVAGYSVGLGREASLAADLRALWRLFILLVRTRPSIIVFGTPKMGVLGALASWLVRVPVRVYLIHGLRWQGLYGWRRLGLRWMETIACALSTNVVAVSDSVRTLAVEQLKTPVGKARLIHNGSANGIDTNRFVAMTADDRDAVRLDLGISPDATVFTFVARLTRDKGIHQLAEVWRAISREMAGAHLLVIGRPEPSGPEDLRVLDELASLPCLSTVAHSAQVERLLGAADVNLSLSRREGMATVILEAAACQVPTVAFAVTGTTDAITPATGCLVPLDDLEAFSSAALHYGRDETRRRHAGEAGRERVLREFDAVDVQSAWAAFLADEASQ